MSEAKSEAKSEANGRAMNVVGIIAQKGGAGKTTLAVHLAVAAAQLGRGKGRGRMSMRVLLIDTDEQGSARKWWESRKGKGVDLVAARTLGPALKKIAKPPHG